MLQSYMKNLNKYVFLIVNKFYENKFKIQDVEIKEIIEQLASNRFIFIL